MRDVRPRLASDGGFLTVQFVVAVGLSLLLLSDLANLVVFQYARGVVRAALDEGVRAGSRATAAAAECQARAQAVLDDLLSGPLGDAVVIGCTDTGDRMLARADVTLHAWAPMVPDWSFLTEATAVKERFP